MQYEVFFKANVWVRVKVEAECKADAIEKAYEDVGISSFVGNGGNDKLIGVYGDNVSIEANDEFEHPKDDDVFEI